MRTRFAQTASAIVDENPRVAVLLADISERLFTDALRAHPDRIVNVGIREQLLIPVASGFALAGMRPIVHTYTPFLVERPFEQIKLDLSHQDVGAILVSIGASYDASREGRTHQAPGDVALMSTLPGWTIHVPGHADEMEEQLRSAVESNDRVYIRTTERPNTRALLGGGTHVVRTGSRGTIVAVGPVLDAVLAASEDADVTVLYTATVRPFDSDALVRTLSRPNVVLVEPYLAGTSAPAISDALIDVPHRLLCLGVGNVELRRYGAPQDHDAFHGLDPSGIRTRLESFLAADHAPRRGVSSA